MSTDVRGNIWNEIPADLQQRVLERGIDVVHELATWAYEHRLAWLKLDHLQDLLEALIVFLLRTHEKHGLQIRSLPAVLTSIAKRQKYQRFRDEKYRRRECLAHKPEDDPTPYENAVRFEVRAAVWDALKILSSDERQAILRKHVAGESYREIALALYGQAGRREEGRVSVMLVRARKRLREQLGEGFLR